MAANPNWYDPAWMYRVEVTVAHAHVGENLTDFPLLVDFTDINLANALANGDDFLCLMADDATQLNHEIEYFDQVTGHLVLWVQTDLSASADTLIYIYYGNPASPNQQNMHGTWATNFKLVQHMQEASGACLDSTVNANDSGTPVPARVEGKIDGAREFGGDQVLNCGHGASLDIANAITISAWAQNYYVPLYDVDDLQAMNDDLTKSYVLMNDIDATVTSGWNGGLGFIPIGTELTPFCGNFEGNGFTISNLFINRPLESYVGLFGFAEPVSGTDAKIENITLSNVNITGGINVGSLCGYNYKLDPTNCHSSGTVTAIGITAGGLFGNVNKSTVVNKCSTSCNVTAGGGGAGGFVGYIGGYRPGTVVNDCLATGSVDGGTGSAGGFAGEYYSRRTPAALISRCYSTGAVTGSGVLGGWAANSSYSGATADCFWDTQTSGQATSYCGATGKTTVEMKQQLTFTNYDFVTIWDITENVTYPWLRAIVISGDVVLISKGRDAYSLEMNLAGETLKGFINNTEVSVAITPNAMMLVAMRYDGVALKLFVDGVEAATTPLAGAINTNITDLKIGENFIGAIDEAKISNEAKSDNWIATGYNNQLPLPAFKAEYLEHATYFDLKMTDSDTIAIPSAKVVIYDKNGQVVTEELTGVDGRITKQALLLCKTVHRIVVKEYDYTSLDFRFALEKDEAWTLSMVADPYITKNKAQAGALDGTCNP